jgi:alpha-amylase/alpha-mannosidase (GH57 family)
MIWASLLHIYQPPHWDARVIDKVVRESYRPILSILSRNPRVRVTLNINASLTEQLVRLGFTDVISGIRDLAERGQIEFTGSAKYHPILPLLPLEEVRRQIQLNTETNRSIFGPTYAPRGFFPPEMAASLEVISVLQELGYEWVALDEIASADPSDGSTFAHISPFDFTAILRNRTVSDYLSFLAPPDDPSAFFQQLDPKPESTLVTAFDGENLGHHRPGTDRLWEQLVTDPRVTMITFSEFITREANKRVIDLRPSSWSTRIEDLENNVPYPLWDNPANQLHQLQWSLTRLVIDAVLTSERHGDPGHEAARLLLDEALASDQFWWASATPWWSVEIIQASAQRLTMVLASLTSLSATERRELEQIAEVIAKTARTWQDSGEAARRRTAYLRAAQSVKYLGGVRIDAPDR